MRVEIYNVLDFYSHFIVFDLFSQMDIVLFKKNYIANIFCKEQNC